MQTAEYFHFLRPYCLLAFIPLLLLLWQVQRQRLVNRNWEAFCDLKLLPHILNAGVNRSRGWILLWATLAGSLTILALAGPVWKKLPQAVFSSQSALVIALDLSRSMDANDITPSRIARARFKISDILDARATGQTAMLVYAGDAFVVTPLTDDTETIKSQLNALTIDIMPVLGNNTQAAIKKAQELLVQAGMSRGHILLVTDEIAVAGVADAVDALREKGFQLSILGVGTKHGVPVPLADGSFLKDSHGDIIIPVLDADAMRELAIAGAGQYQKLEKEDDDIQALLPFFQQTPAVEEGEASELKTDVWYEQGPWLLLMVLPLVAFGFRKGYMLIAVLILLPFSDGAMAFDWRSLWLTADQQGSRAMEAEQYKQAQALFTDDSWKASAAYRAKDYETALENLKSIASIDGRYNSGNALARLGRYKEAIAAYDEVLEQNPEHEDALFNKELLEKHLEQQQQQQQGESEQQNDSEQQQNEAAGEQQQGSQSQQQEQQQEQQQNEQQSQDDTQNEEAEQQQEGQQAEQEKQGEQGEQGEQQVEAEQNDEQTEQSEQQAQAQAKAEESADEEQQATEQWLRRIPDDPSGLLKRKFRYQYGRRQDAADKQDKSW